LEQAKAFFPSVELGRDVAEACVRIGSNIKSEGHRGDYVMALAAQAHAALNGAKRTTLDDLSEVAPLALQHRKSGVLQSGSDLWSPEDDAAVLSLLAGDRSA
jgi:magnesium chelatase subunit I